ncbi:MAG: hypothetical protein QNJ51_26235 [Calothrix sp. MO_167.B12]|nr:hypothetical protein [Calothrix sp. MO_167.B12]
MGNREQGKDYSFNHHPITPSPHHPITPSPHHPITLPRSHTYGTGINGAIA